MRASADRSIVVTPVPLWRHVLDQCQPRRWVTAASLSFLVLAAALFPSGGEGRASAAALVSRASDPTVAHVVEGGTGLYPLVPLPAPPGGPVPLGKGMWIYRFNRAESGDVQAIVARAQAAGLTHLYVRVGSAWDGFYAQPVLDRLLPAAHQAGIKVVGWDFPSLANPLADADRAIREIWYAAPTGDRMDAFSADIETPAEGTRTSGGTVFQYGQALRSAVGRDYPLIATVPRPGGRPFPYASLAPFDAIAPMVYWGTRDPVVDVTNTLRNLAVHGKPVLPIGQAYDMAEDGGPAGRPGKDDLTRFMQAAAAHGAPGVSFWVWDSASADEWAAVSEFKQFHQ